VIFRLDIRPNPGHRSGVESVTLRVTNENDNAPAVTAGQIFAVDGGLCNVIGRVAATDADDTNQPGFTVLQGFAIVGGDGAGIFAIEPGTGTLSIAHPLSIDFWKPAYSVLVTAGDGLNTSSPERVDITIPGKVDVSHKGDAISVSRHAAPAHLRHGDCLGTGD
jgi:hypothetical protein